MLVVGFYGVTEQNIQEKSDYAVSKIMSRFTSNISHPSFVNYYVSSPNKIYPMSTSSHLYHTCTGRANFHNTHELMFELF